MTTFIVKIGGVLIAAALSLAFVDAYNSTSSVQRGNPGLGMDIIEKNDRLIALTKANVMPPSLPPASQEGQLAIDAYKNVQVLGHITSGEMTRLMTAMATWVSPKQGCAYCHAPQRDAAGNIVKDEDGVPQADQNNLHSDELYTKKVARRMLQMTMQINSGWKTHVKETGVTCYTCHRGNPVPNNIWYDETPSAANSGGLGDRAGQNVPSMIVGLTALPTDVFRPYLADDEGIRIISTEPLPIDNRLSIKQAEWSYGLMMHISGALGVNCTHCHNTRSMAAWGASPPARAQAWYGIRMARALNKDYLEPLGSIFPAERLGPTGDAPKLNCATCHQGAYRPLLGQSMLKDYMVLAEAKPQPQKTVVPAVPTDATGAAVPGAAPGAPAVAPAGTPAAGTPAPAGVVPAGTPAPTAAPAAAPAGTPAPAVAPTGTPAAAPPAAAPVRPAAPAVAPQGAPAAPKG